MKNYVTALIILVAVYCKAQAPTASFVLSQYSVCPSSPIQVMDQSTGSPSTYTYVVDGTTSLNIANPILSFTADGVHYVEQYVQNGSGISAPFGQTVLVHPSPVVATGSVGSVTLFPPNGSTNGWSPLVYTFNDPMPPNSVLSGVTVTFSGVDQGWGGTGDPAIFYLAGKQVGYAQLWHTVNNYTITKMAPFPNYNYGGANTLDMYFTGYPGWQGFFNNGILILHYHTMIPPATICAGTSVLLNGIGASTYTWLPSAPNGLTFTPVASTIYTLAGTSAEGCVGYATQQINVSSAAVTASSGAICPGQNFTINPQGALTYTVTGNNFTVAPGASTSYSITGTNSLGCVSLSPAVVSVTVVPMPLITVNSGSACIGSIFTLQPGGASTYTYQGGSSTLIVTGNANYSVTGSNSLGCEANVPAFANITAVPLPTITVPPAMICKGNSYTIQPTGASTYTFSSGSPVVSPPATSSYTISGTNMACTSQTVITLLVDECAGIDEQQQTMIVMYPNPANEFVIIESSGSASYIISDLQGRLIKAGVLIPGHPLIAVDELCEGIYLFNIQGQPAQRLIISH